MRRMDFFTERYFRLRYELDVILPDATIEFHRGRFVDPPYERWVTIVHWVGYA